VRERAQAGGRAGVNAGTHAHVHAYECLGLGLKFNPPPSGSFNLACVCAH
jgi:hypothetical protein